MMKSEKNAASGIILPDTAPGNSDATAKKSSPVIIPDAAVTELSLSESIDLDSLQSGEKPDPDRSVCFTGHRRIPPVETVKIRFSLQNCLRILWEKGFRFFLCGGALGFDTIAAEEVLFFRESHPDAKLILVLPCKSQADQWSKSDRLNYDRILRQADRSILLSDFYYTGCMLTRDRFMVDHASVCICYMTKMQGGTWYTVRYAVQQNCKVLNLAMPVSDHSFLKESPWNYTSTSPFAKANANTAPLYLSRTANRRLTHILISCSGKPSSGKKNRTNPSKLFISEEEPLLF